MATTKIIIATIPNSGQIKTYNMTTSRKAEILHQMAVATDVKLGLQPTKISQPDTNPAPRKRQRLTHLSPEEKMMRRKLKNRVAAQTARDRKKAQMDGLESTASILETRNKRLQIENALLRKQNQSLAEENIHLKQRLQDRKEKTGSVVVLDHGYCESTTSVHRTVKREVEVKPSEPAVLIAPLQQELAHLLLTFLSMMLSWSLMTSFLGCSASSTRLLPVEPFASSAIARKGREEEPLCLVTRKSRQGKAGSQAWWGPQQRSWNPSKN